MKNISTQKVKQSHNTTMEAQVGMMYSSYSVTTSALDGVSGQRHAPAALYTRRKNPGTHCTGGWVGPRAGLDTEIEEKSLASAGDLTSIARSSSP
jgi:hypothetical protein